MKNPINSTNKMITNTVTQVFSATLLCFMATVQAGTEEPYIADPYVDSITKWGAWELDIEPAAGGLTAPVTQPLNVRDSALSIRTNSFSALAPHQQALPPGGGPTVPITPPFGGPSDGLF